MQINPQAVSLRISAGLLRQFPRDPMPQVAFSGRSNVGKSSLINCLLGRKSLARVSATPGKTITVNFYDVDRKLFLVDLPGYGFAKRSSDSQKQWSRLTEDFFVNNPNRDLVRLVVQLIDARIGPTDDDRLMMDWMRGAGVPFLVVATKCDKLTAPALTAALEQLSQQVSGCMEPPIPFSAVTRMGKDRLWNAMLAAIERGTPQ